MDSGSTILVNNSSVNSAHRTLLETFSLELCLLITRLLQEVTVGYIVQGDEPIVHICWLR